MVCAVVTDVALLPRARQRPDLTQPVHSLLTVVFHSSFNLISNEGPVIITSHFSTVLELSFWESKLLSLLAKRPSRVPHIHARIQIRSPI